MNAHARPQVTVVEVPRSLAEAIVPLVATAVDNLRLAGRLSAIGICADDLEGPDSAWYRFETPAGQAAPALSLFCPLDCFLKLRPAESTTMMRSEIWEQRPAPRAERVVTGEDFSPKRASIFLHHHLLTVRDILDGKLDSQAGQPRWSEALAAAWAVGVDGRLNRSGLPGYPLAERRGTFSRLFSSAGVLMPDHWQVFQSLWEGGLVSQQDILGAVRHLPRL